MGSCLGIDTYPIHRSLKIGRSRPWHLPKVLIMYHMSNSFWIIIRRSGGNCKVMWALPVQIILAVGSYQELCHPLCQPHMLSLQFLRPRSRIIISSFRIKAVMQNKKSKWWFSFSLSDHTCPSLCVHYTKHIYNLERSMHFEHKVQSHHNTKFCMMSILEYKPCQTPLKHRCPN